MSDYKVQLEIFEGPLDLLLYLVKKNEVDIYCIPISKITTQYMEYLELLKVVIPDVAGEFVVMGATLMYIKSRMLLPEDQQVVDPDAPADELDPRWDLIRQLVEYKKFKDAALDLQDRELQQQSLYARQFVDPQLQAPMDPLSGLKQVSVFDLLGAFKKVLNRIQQENLHEIFEEHFTVSDKIDFILRLIEIEERTAFSNLFEGMASRTEIVVTFLAILELIRLHRIGVVQSENFGEIEIVRISAEPITLPEEPSKNE